MSLTKPTANELMTAYCKLFLHKFDGPVFIESIRNETRWVGHLECPQCGSRRTDRMMPKSYELVSRDYEHGVGYDPTMTHEDAKKIWYGHRLNKTGKVAA